MKKYARFSAFMLAVILLFSSLYITPYAADITKGDFVFSQSSGTLTLKKYKGNGGSVTVPSSVDGKKVTAIGNQAFAEYYDSTPDSRRLTKIVIPDSVTSIGKQAFQECTKLNAVEMTGVRKIGEAAFWYCISLKKAATSSALKTIGKNAFGKCENLKIYCEKGSEAEAYAKKNSIKYAPLYPSKISFSKSAYYVEKGKSVQLSVVTTPSDVYFKKYKWSMSGSNASISQSGKVTGKKIGTDMVTCTSVYGDSSAECFISIKRPSPQGFSVDGRKFDYIRLSWKKTSGASGYDVETEKNGKWVRLTRTTKLSYTVNGLTENTEYKFRIRAYYKQNGFVYYSDWVKLTAKTRSLSKVTNIKAGEYFYDELSFSWSKVSYATGYQVYALNSSGKYVKIKTTSKTSLRHSLSESTVKRYKVRAYAAVQKGNIYGAFSDTFTFSTQPSPIKNLKVTEITKTGISIKWDKVKNASGYRIYSVSGDEYTFIKSTAATSYSATGLKSSKKYTYAVRAYISTTLKTTYGDYSSKISATTLPAISNEERAVMDITGAMKKIAGEKDIYVSLSTKVQLSVESCSGNASQRNIVSAYTDTFVRNKIQTYNFENGKADENVSVADIFIPENGFSFSDTDIKSTTREKDGSGFEFNTVLKSETVKSGKTPKLNSHIWGMIDENEVKEAIKEDLALVSMTVKYSGTVINTKINADGEFDTLTITVPFEATVVCASSSGQFETTVSGKIIKDYIIVRW